MGKDVTVAVGAIVGFVVGVATIVERAETVGVEIAVGVAKAEHAEMHTATKNKRITREKTIRRNNQTRWLAMQNNARHSSSGRL